MSLDERKWLAQDKQYPEAALCVRQSNSMKDALPSYQYLNDLRGRIPKELYAYQLRRILQMNTANVPDKLRLEMLNGVAPEDIMFQDELDAIKGFDEFITIYRGTTKDEDIPGICWTRYKWVAEDTFYRGRLFEAVIPKCDILLYLAHQEDEGEIIAEVKSRYRIIDEG